MAISFVQAGTLAVTTGTGTLTLTGASAGNFLVLAVLSDGLAHDYAFGAFTNIQRLNGTLGGMDAYGANSNVGNPVAGVQDSYLGRVTANGTSSIQITVGASGEDTFACLYEFSGVHTGTAMGDVIEAGAEVADTGTTISDLSVTTTGSNRLAWNIIIINDDQAVTEFTGETGGSWAEAHEFVSATGTQATIQLQIAAMPEAGTINGGTFTIAGSSGWAGIASALIPNPAYRDVILALDYSRFPKSKLRRVG